MSGSSGPPGPASVGVVDPRPLVRAALAAALGRVSGLRLVGSYAGWPEVVPADLDRTVWLSPSGHPGTRSVAVEDLDVADLTGLAARVRQAACVPPAPAGVGRPSLSPREDAVLSAVAAGVPAARTAADLGISPRAVQAARQRAMAKLGVSTQVEAVRLAHELRSAGVPLTRVPVPRTAPDDDR
ncbi:hypothetical protein F1C76_18435 [Geodermatophilaceae bacterium NBWT11]|nr:hypothetical protein F1C76_18435 [Geodermatophilaceae bacterium NBWT11]